MNTELPNNVPKNTDTLKQLIPDKYHTDLPFISGSSFKLYKYVVDSKDKLQFAAVVWDKTKLAKILREDFIFYFNKNGLWAVKIKFKSENISGSMKESVASKINAGTLAKRVNNRSKELFHRYKTLYGKPVKNSFSMPYNSIESKDLKTESVVNEWNSIQQPEGNISVKLFESNIAQKKIVINRDLTELYINESKMPPGYLLIQAIERDNIAQAEKLINDGAGVNCINIDDRMEYYSPLMCAITKNNPNLVGLLLNKGAFADYMMPGGQTALSLAIYENRTNIVKMLVDAGADVSIQTPNGVTPLMTAAYNGNEEAVKILLKANADKSVKDKNGHTAIDFAISKNFQSIVRLLK
ncbi:MAG: ankyrin repeat domain-containing protein [Endomicrobiales bacterium]|nr:ankyrin repeat domain-containing protein [Endomicrobiales bacterium]